MIRKIDHVTSRRDHVIRKIDHVTSRRDHVIRSRNHVTREEKSCDSRSGGEKKLKKDSLGTVLVTTRD